MVSLRLPSLRKRDSREQGRDWSESSLLLAKAARPSLGCEQCSTIGFSSVTASLDQQVGVTIRPSSSTIRWTKLDPDVAGVTSSLSALLRRLGRAIGFATRATLALSGSCLLVRGRCRLVMVRLSGMLRPVGGGGASLWQAWWTGLSLAAWTNPLGSDRGSLLFWQERPSSENVVQSGIRQVPFLPVQWAVAREPHCLLSLYI